MTNKLPSQQTYQSINEALRRVYLKEEDNNVVILLTKIRDNLISFVKEKGGRLQNTDIFISRLDSISSEITQETAMDMINNPEKYASNMQSTQTESFDIINFLKGMAIGTGVYIANVMINLITLTLGIGSFPLSLPGTLFTAHSILMSASSSAGLALTGFAFFVLLIVLIGIYLLVRSFSNNDNVSSNKNNSKKNNNQKTNKSIHNFRNYTATQDDTSPYYIALVYGENLNDSVRRKQSGASEAKSIINKIKYDANSTFLDFNSANSIYVKITENDDNYNKPEQQNPRRGGRAGAAAGSNSEHLNLNNSSRILIITNNQKLSLARRNNLKVETGLDTKKYYKQERNQD